MAVKGTTVTLNINGQLMTGSASSTEALLPN